MAENLGFDLSSLRTKELCLEFLFHSSNEMHLLTDPLSFQCYFARKQLDLKTDI